MFVIMMSKSSAALSSDSDQFQCYEVHCSSVQTVRLGWAAAVCVPWPRHCCCLLMITGF